MARFFHMIAVPVLDGGRRLGLAGAVMACCGAALAACVLRGGMDQVDAAFYGGHGERVVAAMSIDDDAQADREDVWAALERAARHREVALYYGHNPLAPPGRLALPVERVDALLTRAAALGLQTFPVGALDDFDPAVHAGGLCLSFDDHAIAGWTALRPILRRHGARVTFYVDRSDRLDDEALAALRRLARDGHEIGAHGWRHRDAVAHAAEVGVAAWLATEVLPSRDHLRALGFEVHTFAYPVGRGADSLDDALLEHFSRVRHTARARFWE